MSRVLLASPLFFALVACGPQLPPAAAPSPLRSPEPAPVVGAREVPRLPTEALRLDPGAPVAGEGQDAAALFERAGHLLSARKYRQALALYDRLLRLAEGSRLVSPSLYNAGLAHEWLRDFGGAAGRYRELLRRFGSTREAVDAAFRLGGCHAELGDWSASARVFAELLRRKDLTASDRLECLAREGLAHYRLGDHSAARRALEEAVAYHSSVEAVERLDTDYFVAMARYYQAAIPHLEFRQLKVDRGAGLARTLDEKARLLLLAQLSYIKTIRLRNPFWATAAGFQIGSLYRELYLVLLTTLPDFTGKAAQNARMARIPLPKAKEQLVQAYLEEVHRTVKPLLDKAIRVFEKNLQTGERAGVQSDWVLKSRAQVNELKHLLTLPPAAAVKLVTDDQRLPEDRPGAPAGRRSPTFSPERWPSHSRPEPSDEDEEAEDVVL